jgi:Holliday junction resolvasome RuvABC endonuclease subunit
VSILCLDPSKRRTGWAVVSSDLEIVKYGAFSTKGNADECMLQLRHEIETLCKVFQVTEIVTEDPAFFQRGSSRKGNKVMVAVSYLILCLGEKFKAPVTEIAPTSLKLHFAGYGRADKEDMGKEVIKQTGIDTRGDEDIDDALAIAQLVIHHTPNGLRSLLDSKKKKRKKVERAI